MDLAQTIGAKNSMEKMQAHQMATSHRLAMHYAKLALESKDIPRGYQAAKVSMAAMRSFQQGQDSFHRGLRGGRQVVTVQRVNVNEGGQAVIAGQVNERGARPAAEADIGLPPSHESTSTKEPSGDGGPDE